LARRRERWATGTGPTGLGRNKVDGLAYDLGRKRKRKLVGLVWKEKKIEDEKILEFDFDRF
jgi:hypothetical protein